MIVSEINERHVNSPRIENCIGWKVHTTNPFDFTVLSTPSHCIKRAKGTRKLFLDSIITLTYLKIII